jgi:Malonyl-CoA decarboxylase C-terminal domain
VRELRQVLVPLCAHYLLHVKNGAEPLDPVARFHLRNGARLERINWLGDTSEAGIGRSATIMANYLYRPSSLERNQELYLRQLKVIASRRVQRLAQSCFLSRQDLKEWSRRKQGRADRCEKNAAKTLGTRGPSLPRGACR